MICQNHYYEVKKGKASTCPYAFVNFFLYRFVLFPKHVKNAVYVFFGFMSKWHDLLLVSIL